MGFDLYKGYFKEGKIREGNRGGLGLFNWDQIKGNVHKECYLGNTVKASEGRWQNHKNIHWYVTKKEEVSAVELDEIAEIKRKEQEAMNEALGINVEEKDEETIAAEKEAIKRELQGTSLDERVIGIRHQRKRRNHSTERERERDSRKSKSPSRKRKDSRERENDRYKRHSSIRNDEKYTSRHRRHSRSPDDEKYKERGRDSEREYSRNRNSEREYSRHRNSEQEYSRHRNSEREYSRERRNEFDRDENSTDRYRSRYSPKRRYR